MTCSENKTTVTKLFISTGSDHNETNGTISFINQNIDDIFFSISPSEGIYIDVPDTAVSSVLDFIGNVLLNTTVVVSADETVRVYVQQYCNNTAVGSYGQCSTTYRVRGVDEIGREYWVLMHYLDNIAKIAILALEDDTIVRLTPPSNSTDDTLEVTIDALQTLYVGHRSDMSGTRINASRPILRSGGHGGMQLTNCCPLSIPILTSRLERVTQKSYRLTAVSSLSATSVIVDSHEEYIEFNATNLILILEISYQAIQANIVPPLARDVITGVTFPVSTENEWNPFYLVLWLSNGTRATDIAVDDSFEFSFEEYSDTHRPKIISLKLPFDFTHKINTFNGTHILRAKVHAQSDFLELGNYYVL
ncbi:hypothetical protein BSL78_16751 [Apostichopus japonicus]|uniref:IgGFc-binding protein N-terminal domain-containing protein n=1 Tax=Stichopus japonicus TaxID=307972 RepID=A0A2G8KEI4_STIJA|nr:hypothetical protein BSL78_16751 [Apostichopus japonicus]